MSEPLIILAQMRAAISAAIDETEGFGYEDFNEEMLKLRRIATKLARQFDHYYSDDDAAHPEQEREKP